MMKISVSGEAVFSEKGDIINGHINGEASSENYQIRGRYEFFDVLSDSRLVDDLENFELYSSFGITENLRVNSSSKYDFSESSMAKASMD